ncbi:MAG: hypothetical protein AB8B86_15250 [Pseudomonadales bacterium]
MSTKVAVDSPKEFELFALYKEYLKGSGHDDGVQIEILDNPARYAEEVMLLLEESTPGSYAEEVALFASEPVLTEKGVADSLKDYGANHAEPETKCFIDRILDGSPIAVPVSSSLNGKVEVVLVLPSEPCSEE